MAAAGARSAARPDGRSETTTVELFSLTYGTIVAQLLKDFEDPVEVNTQLKRMGRNIGVRIVDDFFAKRLEAKCRDFRDTMETIARDAFPMYLGVTGAVDGWSADGSTCSLRLADNPLADWVELPASCEGLRYSNLLTGVLEGALEMVQFKVDAELVREPTAGDDVTEIRVILRQVIAEEAADEYKDE